jgi:signal transduction histidine kinase
MRRRKLRRRLTLLYAIPFLISGALLLSIPLLQVRESAPVGTTPGPGGHASESPVLRHIFFASMVGLALMVAVSFLMGWLIAGFFLRPLRTITATARDISATNLHRRLNLTQRRDEFADLSDTLDDLFARLEASFASQRNFVANASHELRTPLTAERALLQVALADPAATTDSLRATCQDVLALGEHQERLIESLLTLATSERGVEHREPVDLAEVASRVLLGRPDPGVRVSSSLSPTWVAGDPHLIGSLVANLVDNAVRHNISGGWVSVTTVDGSVTVQNTGPVIPAAEVDRLFQPFQQLGTQRTRRGGGHGLGLAIVRAISTAHGAELVARARTEGGLDVRVAFEPVAADGPRGNL